MSLLLKGGISKLSELIIDADKNWAGKTLTNCGGLAAGMAIGHILQHNGVILQTLAPGVATHVLTSEGPGHLVTWAPGGMYLYRFFPVDIDATHIERVFVPDHDIPKLAPMATALGADGHLNPGWYQRLTPEIARALSVAVFTPDHSDVEPVPYDTYAELVAPVNGAVADDGGVQTDETAAARSGPVIQENYTVNDDGQQDCKPNDWEAQTFTTVGAHTLRFVRLKVYRSGTPGNITIAIKATDGLGHPTGPDLAVGSFNGNIITATSPGEWITVWLVTPVNLAAATKYAIIVEANANTLYWRSDNTAPAYAGGNREYSTDNGVSWNTDNAKDFMFEEWGTVNDMTLLPPAPLQVGDAYYFGHAKQFYKLIQDIGVAGAGTYVLAWEYWDSVAGAWQACVGLNDGTSAFQNLWTQDVTHTPQATWGLTVVQAMNLYWIRARVTNAGAGYSQPLGTWAKVAIQV
jgi:hypothetical protein